MQENIEACELRKGIGDKRVLTGLANDYKGR